MKIAGLQKVTLIDYPGRIAASVFLAGCNLDCGYCYNRWMIDAAQAPEAMPVNEFHGWLGRRVGLLDGVCVSGGEPTIHAELAGFLRRIVALGFAVKLDTNGTRPACLKALLDEHLLDYVALDLKAPLDERYSLVAGREVDLSAIRESLAILRGGEVEYELRTTVGPQLDAGALRDLAGLIEGDERWFLQPFVPAPTVDPALAGAEAMDGEALREIAEELAGIAPGVRVRGE